MTTMDLLREAAAAGVRVRLHEDSFMMEGPDCEETDRLAALLRADEYNVLAVMRTLYPTTDLPNVDALEWPLSEHWLNQTAFYRDACGMSQEAAEFRALAWLRDGASGLMLEPRGFELTGEG